MFLKSGAIFLLLISLTEAEKLTLADIDDSMVVDDEILVRSPDELYRLPTNVLPMEYDIYIDLYFSESTDYPFSYNGREDIIIQATEENVKQIVLHANVQTIRSVKLLSDGVVQNLAETPYTLAVQYHFLQIYLQQPLVINKNYTLQLEYTNKINDGPMKRGLWRGWYKDANGVERIYATTHFQPYNARQAFPCWDEPSFKAVFNIHLSAPATYIKMFSNTKAESIESNSETNRITTNFYPTPKMSSYLVTFLVSETFQVIAEDRTFNPPIRIIGRSNTAGLGNHALELAVKMTQFFDQYFEIPYSSLHPYLMNDHISSPDWASAATENWGMVSYRELYMIIDPKETIMSTEQYAATLVSHELAHKWMGNLITCFWWSNTWINEGFASYFGYIAAHAMFPKYELHEHFNSRYLQGSLSFDSGTSTVPLNHEVNTPAQVTGHFGTISYSKGAAFLRMIVDMITPETFRKACKYFLVDNAYQPANQVELFNAFSKAVEEDGTLEEYQNFNFTEFYRIWVDKPGYPILNVDVNHSTGEMRLTQERFFLSATAKPTGHVYPIPITFSTKTKPNFEQLKPTYMMSADKVVLRKDPGEEWVIFNNQQHSLYRVNYDEKTWNLIANALLETPESIHHLNRAQVANDVFALMRANRLTYNFGFKILRFLEKETNYHVWNPAISGYTWIRNRFRHIPGTQSTFDAYILSQMEHVVDTLGFEPATNETTTVSVDRQEVLHFVCLLGHGRCVKESRDRFISLRENGTWVDPRIRRNVYVVGIRKGGVEDFNFLLDRFQTSNFANDKLEMLRGLAATRDPQLLMRYLALILTKEVRSQDKVNAFNYALLGNKENAKTVLQFVKNNIDNIRKAFVEDSPPNPVHTALSNLASYLDEEYLVEYEEWLNSTQTNTLQYRRAISAINSARNVIAWGRANGDMIISATKSGAGRILSSTILVLVSRIADGIKYFRLVLIINQRVMFKILKLVIPALISIVSCELPLDVEEIEVYSNVGEEIYRLPEDLDPLSFQVEITPYFEAEGTKEAFTFDGIVEINVKALNDGISTLVLHENVKEIVTVTVHDSAGTLVVLNGTSPFVREQEYHFLKINLQQGTLKVNETYKITINYIGNINETPLSRGVFRGSYLDNSGKKHWYVATHLQPTNSRQAFPCFDEPGFKSVFNIIINRPLTFTETYSNMPILRQDTVNNRTREIFRPTPKMSAYLVTFHISEEFTAIADNRNATHPYRILARPNAAGQGEYALEVGPPLTKWFSDYLGVDYYSMDSNLKNDQIAVPDWASGATENWGLVSYRELRLLYEEGETNAVDKMSIATITSHELAHKWFGNLVTCRWWNNVWINEGFASYFEDFAMHEIDQSLERADQFNIQSLQSALSSDSSASTRALEHTVNTPAQVTGHFSGISYTKGASLLLMLKNLIGENTFKKALNYYLVDRSYKHALPTDLYTNFAKAVAEDTPISSDWDIAAIFQNWVEQPGSPVIDVYVDMNTGLMNITQERFYINPSSETNQQLWHIPLTFTSGSNPDWNNLKASHLMTGKSYQIRKAAGHEWVIFNVQQKGLYRVNYDTHTWEMTASALEKNHSSIHHLNRAQIVNDVFAFMRSEKISFELGFKILNFLKKDTSYYSWYPAITGFSWIRNRFLHIPNTLREFDRILFDFLRNVISELEYDYSIGEPLTRTLNRFYILQFACSIGHEGCSSDSVFKFNALRSSGSKVNPNLRRHVFCQGLLNGNYSDWKFMYDRRLNSNNQADEVAMLRALGCTRNSQAVEEYLQMVLSDNVKAQDSVNAMTFLYMGNRANAKIALEFLKTRVEQFRRKVVLPAWFGSLLSNLASYLDEEGLNNMESWLRSNQDTIPSASTGLSAITSAKSNMDWGTRKASSIIRAARGSAFSTVSIFTCPCEDIEMYRHTLKWTVFALLVVIAVSDTNYRLNSTLTPSSYSIIITPYFDTGDDNAFTFDGEVRIRMRTETSTNQIKIHSEDLNFNSSDISITSGSVTIQLNEANPLEFDTKYTFAYINLASELMVGYDYELKINYRGPIRDDLNGFYKNYYIENGVKKWLGATQMQPTHARKVFPCFDEPEYKAVFTLTIDRPQNYKPSLANTKMQESKTLSNNYVREVFYPTPIMSTYLVAFLVSEFEGATTMRDGNKELGVFSRPDAVNQTEYAVDIGQKVVDALGNYFGIDYYSVDANLKLDHVALTDFRAGAMENWGLIKYRESLLLYVPEDSTPYYKYRVAQIVAHETTHMWFGDLVTCHWWSNAWLNEGFANYFQDYITAMVDTTVGASDQLIIGSVYAAYDADDKPESVPATNIDVNSPAEISDHFGTITYQKAGSVIRMMHHFLGNDAFKYGLNSYLNNNRFKPSTPEMLYAGLEEGVATFGALSNYPGYNITDVMGSWISRPGYPILHVDVDYANSKVTLKQERFYIDSTKSSSELYKIPITYTTSDVINFENTKPSFVMDEETHELSVNITEGSWIIFNVQETGYYRVNYDDRTWQLISDALKGNQREQIHYLNRAKIVNDLFAFLFADVVKFEMLYDTLEFLHEENSYPVWYAAIRGLKKLRNMYLGSEVVSQIDAFSRKLLDSAIAKLGYEANSTDDYDTLRNRMQVLDFACNLGHQGCLDNTLAHYKELKDNGKEISPSLRPVSYCTGLRFGSGEDYDFMWNRMAATNVANEARTIGEVLGCTSDQDKLRSFLVSTQLENSPIRTQDLTVPLAGVLSNYSNVALVIEELDKNLAQWKTIYPSIDTALTSIASALHTQKEFDTFDSWLTSCTECGEEAVTKAKNSLAKAKAVTTWADNHRADIMASFKGSARAVTSSAFVILAGITWAVFAL
ncbi:unnamed protein product [Leptosia nina]|uniref:Aminopeptidase N n=1 Tax=Leptosia nina TaxID=320188 RepID=A0AAV1JCF9_9NEOP